MLNISVPMLRLLDVTELNTKIIYGFNTIQSNRILRYDARKRSRYNDEITSLTWHQSWRVWKTKNVFQGKFDCVIIELIDGGVTNKMLLLSTCCYSFYFK